MSTTDPEQIRADIERTRAELSQDVDALEDKVSPGRVAQRQADRVRSRVSAVKDHLMGTAGGARAAVGDAAHTGAGAVGGTAHDLGSSAGDLVSGAGHAVKDLPGAVARRTEGNPLAVGLIAFAAGWLVGSVIPASRAEQQAAEAVKERASGAVAEATSVAKETAENLREPLLDAADQVKQAAADAATTLKDHGSEAAADLKDQAGDAKDAVRDRTNL